MVKCGVATPQPKIEAAHRLIEWLNCQQENLTPIPLLPLDTSPVLENSWLSGMIDSDGSFYVNLYTRTSCS
jgi:hypothetical protein